MLLSLTRRIDDTSQFFASAALSFLAELVGALIYARAWRLEVTLPRQARVAPAASAAPTHLPAQHAKGGPSPPTCEDTLGARDRELRLLIATRVAHEELGEKCAVILGCGFAQCLGGISSALAANAIALIVLEAVCDALKAAVWAAHAQVDVAHVRFTFHWPTLLGLICVGASTCCNLLAALRFDCLTD